MIVKIHASTLIRENGLDNISSDYYAKLENKVKSIILKSIERAKANKRKTLMSRDI